MLPASASAAFHLTKVSEVYPGTAAPDSAFIEIQAYTGGQNLLSGHRIDVYGSGGTVVHSFEIPSNAPSGESQRTFLVADASPPDGVAEDYTDSTLGGSLPGAGGAVCFETIDCVAWGSINTAGLPPGTAVGTPAPAIPGGSSLTRSIAPGCATLLEASDDTDDSAADFSVTADPTPRPNTVAPTETACGGGGGGGGAAPQTEIDKGPRKKIEGKTAKFKFSSLDPAATFQCALDKKPFKACTSPYKLKRIKPGKHVFSVRAVLDGVPDGTPAKYRFRRKKP